MMELVLCVLYKSSCHPPRRNPPSLTICLEGPKNRNFPPEVHSYLQDFARGVSAYPKKVQLVRKTPTLGGLSATLPETSLIHKPCLPTPSRINSSLFFLGSSPYILSAEFPPSLPQGASLSSSQNHHLGGYPPLCNFLSFLCLVLGSLGSTALLGFLCPQPPCSQHLCGAWFSHEGLPLPRLVNSQMLPSSMLVIPS